MFRSFKLRSTWGLAVLGAGVLLLPLLIDYLFLQVISERQRSRVALAIVRE
jgi:hypothetical protein